MLIYHRFIDWFVKIISSYKFIMMFHAIHAAPMQPLSTFRRDVKRSPTWLEKGPSERNAQRGHLKRQQTWLWQLHPQHPPTAWRGLGKKHFDWNMGVLLLLFFLAYLHETRVCMFLLVMQMRCQSGVSNLRFFVG